LFIGLACEINVCSTAFRYQLSQVWPPSFNSQKGRLAKVKDGIISEAKLLGTVSVDQYIDFKIIKQKCSIYSRHCAFTSKEQDKRNTPAQNFPI
jgi:hypothetical protein